MSHSPPGSDSSIKGVSSLTGSGGSPSNQPSLAFKDLPIRRKVTAVIMVTSVTVLLVTAASFIVYDFLTYKRLMAGNLSTRAAMMAAYSGEALASGNGVEAARLL